MTSSVAQLIRLSLTLETSLGLMYSPGAQKFDRVLSTISNSNQYAKCCTENDILM